MLLDLNNFGPFRADVWGTVSDWIIVLISTFTLFFLYHTLKSQRKATESQAEATRLQAQATADQVELSKLTRIQFEKDIMPGLVIQNILDSKSGGTIRIAFSRNHATDIEILNRSDNAFRFDVSESLKFSSVAEGAPIALNYITEPGVNHQFKFIIRYTNINGSRYEQKAIYNNDQDEFVISAPQLIK